jgi:hypothetical protein
LSVQEATRLVRGLYQSNGAETEREFGRTTMTTPRYYSLACSHHLPSAMRDSLG